MDASGTDFQAHSGGEVVGQRSSSTRRTADRQDEAADGGSDAAELGDQKEGSQEKGGRYPAFGLSQWDTRQNAEVGGYQGGKGKGVAETPPGGSRVVSSLLRRREQNAEPRPHGRGSVMPTLLGSVAGCAVAAGD